MSFFSHLVRFMHNRFLVRLNNVLAVIGSTCINACACVGRFAIFFVYVLRYSFGRFFLKNFFVQLLDIAFYSIFLVALTGFFSGAVLALQSYNGLQRFGVVDSVPAIVILSLFRELGPVLAALMATSRVASRMAAELGGMVITSQISAMTFLGVHPIRFLVVPRVLAMILAMPFLSLIFSIIGCFGGYVVCVYLLDFPADVVIVNATNILEYKDVYIGLVKTVVFGMVISLIACYLGCNVNGGTSYVGLATTNTVVFSSVSVLFLNYILTVILF